VGRIYTVKTGNSQANLSADDAIKKADGDIIEVPAGADKLSVPGGQIEVKND